MSKSRIEKAQKLLNLRQPDLTVFMENVHKPHNLSAIIRTCDAVGVGEVHAVWPSEDMATCKHIASGSNYWVDVKTHSDNVTAIKYLKEQGMQVLAAHFSEQAVDFREIDYSKPTAVLLGAELDGVSEQAASLSDQHIIIPMLGMVQSLNVSVANAVIMYEAQRQREVAGRYQNCQLPEDYCDKKIFAWLQPKVAEFCHKHDLNYPKLDEDGSVADPEWQKQYQQIQNLH